MVIKNQSLHFSMLSLTHCAHTQINMESAQRIMERLVYNFELPMPILIATADDMILQKIRKEE